MQPTPPCPTCGSPLRWFPEHNAWGCDRERKLLPVAAPVAAAAVPGPAMRAPRGPRQPIPKKTLIIAGVAAAVVIGGVAAFLLLRGGGPSGGADSPEELAKSAAAAISNGDVEAYSKLAGMDDFSSFISCHFSDDNSIDDYRQYVERNAKRHKGLVLKVKDVAKKDGEKPKVMKAGRHLMDSCVLNEDMTSYQFDVKLSADSDVDHLTMSATKIAGRWYFENYDELPKGKDEEEGSFDKDFEDMKKQRQKKMDRIRKSVGTSAEAAIRGIADATNWGSYSRAEAISVDRYLDLDDLMKCEYDSELSNKIDHTSSLLRDLAKFPEPDDDDDDQYGGHTYGGRSHDDDAGAHHTKVDIKGVTVKDKGTAPADQDFRGCRPLKSFEWQDLEVKIAVDGKDQDPAQVLAIKVDDAWRILYIRENP